MTFGLYATFANPQGCHIIRGALYRVTKVLGDTDFVDLKMRFAP